MTTIADYPSGQRDSIQRLAETLHTSYESAYAMMLITATLMDLYPTDQAVIDMILKDNAKRSEAACVAEM